MTTRALKIKGEQVSFLAHADSAEQLLTGATTGETPTGWNFKAKGTYLYWVDDDGAERRAEGDLTGNSRAAGNTKVKGETLLYGDINDAERSLPVAAGPVTVEVRVTNALDDVTLEDGDFADDENVNVGDIFNSIWKNAIRFRNVTVPQGATITAAYITLRSGGGNSNTLVRLDIKGNDEDDAVSPTDASEFDNLSEVSSSVSWQGLAAGDFSLVDTPSISDIIQDIVDRGGWSSGNAMQIMINDDGSDSGAGRTFESFDTEEDDAPLLHIEYTP